MSAVAAAPAFRSVANSSGEASTLPEWMPSGRFFRCFSATCRTLALTRWTCANSPLADGFQACSLGTASFIYRPLISA